MLRWLYFITISILSGVVGRGCGGLVDVASCWGGGRGREEGREGKGGVERLCVCDGESGE